MILAFIKYILLVHILKDSKFSWFCEFFSSRKFWWKKLTPLFVSRKQIREEKLHNIILILVFILMISHSFTTLLHFSIFIFTIPPSLGLVHIGAKEIKEEKAGKRRDTHLWSLGPQPTFRQSLVLHEHHNKGGLPALISHQGKAWVHPRTKRPQHTPS